MCGDTKLKEANLFYRNLIKGIESRINVSLLAKVESINLTNMIADIKPLKKDLPLIQNVPIAMMKARDYFIRSSIRVGDIVVVIFSDYSLEGYIENGAVRDLVIDNRHSLDNAVIVGIVAPLNASPSLIKDFDEVVDEIATEVVHREVPPMIGG